MCDRSTSAENAHVAAWRYRDKCTVKSLPVRSISVCQAAVRIGPMHG
jgi:hypothetical protein